MPGAGTRWKHLHRESGLSARGAGAKKKPKKERKPRSAYDDDDDEDEDDDDDDDDDEDDDEDEDDEDGAFGAHLRRAADPRAARGAVVEAHDDDEDELPWQVIALLDASILRDLRASNAYREKRVAIALAGLDVDQPGRFSLEALCAGGAARGGAGRGAAGGGRSRRGGLRSRRRGRCARAAFPRRLDARAALTVVARDGRRRRADR